MILMNIITYPKDDKEVVSESQYVIIDCYKSSVRIPAATVLSSSIQNTAIVF